MLQFILRYRLTLLSIFSGLLFAASWPQNGITALIFIAFVPLFIVENEILTHWEKHHRFSVLLYAWLTFIVFNALTTWWIMYASLPGLLMAVFLNSFFMAVAFYLMHIARRVLPGRQGFGSLVVLWISFEYLHLDWDLSWSWLNLGNVFATIPRWVQWYEYTGALGGTLWILLINMGMYNLFLSWSTPLQPLQVTQKVVATGANPKEQQQIFMHNMQQYRLIRQRIFSGLATFLLLVVPTVLSQIIWQRYDEKADPVEVVVIQPAQDPYAEPANSAEAAEWIDQIVDQANQVITPNTRFVVAPEAALPGSLWLNDPYIHYGFRALMQHAASHDPIAWVAGAMMYRQYPDEDSASATARRFPGREGLFDIYNAAIFVDSESNFDTYFKSKLVPGIEKMPFAQYMKPVGRLVEKFGGTSGSMGVQDKRGVFTGPDGTKVAPVICYESIYGNYLNDYVRNGAQLIFIITNDGWWRQTPGHRQHFHYARLRAVETRRSIARAALTGISGFIDQRGQPTMQTQWWQQEAIINTLNKNDKLTFYVKNGDYLGRLSVFLLALLLAYMATQGYLRRLKGS